MRAGTVLIALTLCSPYLQECEVCSRFSVSTCRGNKPIGHLIQDQHPYAISACLKAWLAAIVFWLPASVPLFPHPWCWERWKAKGEEDDRGWDGWMASLTQWTWIWANPRGWWRAGKPGVLQALGLQRVKHGLATEQQQRWCSPQGAAPGWNNHPRV